MFDICGEAAWPSASRCGGSKSSRPNPISKSKPNTAALARFPSALWLAQYPASPFPVRRHLGPVYRHLSRRLRRAPCEVDSVGLERWVVSARLRLQRRSGGHRSGERQATFSDRQSRNVACPLCPNRRSQAPRGQMALHPLNRLPALPDCQGMFPYAHHAPSQRSKDSCNPTIATLVRLNLHPPIAHSYCRHPKMQRATVPETPINEYSESLTWKGNVRSARDLGVSSPSGDACVLQAGYQSLFCRTVAHRPDARHQNRPFGPSQGFPLSGTVTGRPALCRHIKRRVWTSSCSFSSQRM